MPMSSLIVIELIGLVVLAVAFVMFVAYFQQVRRQLHSGQHLLQSVLDHTDNAVMALDAEYRVVFVNRRYLELWQLDEEFLRRGPTIGEVIGEVCRRGFYAEEQAAELVARRMAQLESALERTTLETPRRDGVVVEGFAARLPGGGFLLTFRDITPRQRAEEALQRSREHLRTLVETVPHGILECDPQGMVTFANGTYVEMQKKVGTGDLGGRSIFDLIGDEESRAEAREAFACALREGREQGTALVRNRDRDDNALWRQIDWTVRRSAAGAINGFIGVVTDVTAQHQAEVQMRTANAVLRGLFHAAPMAIITLDRSGAILFWNPAAELVFGWREDEVSGKDFPLLTLESAEQKRFAAMLQRGSAGETARGDLVAVCRDGRRLDAAVVVGPLQGSSEQAAEVILIIDDISERKRVESALRNSEETYRNLVEKTPVAVFVHVEGYLVYLNPAAVGLFGAASAAELEGQAIANYLDPADRARFIHVVEGIRLDSTPTNRLKLRIRPGSGAEREVEATFLEVEYSGCLARMALCLDVTERNRAERELTESETRFRRLSHEFETIFDGIPDSLTVWSPELRLVWANRATQEFYRQPADQLAGADCATLCRLGCCNESDCEVHRCFVSGHAEDLIRTTTDGRSWGIKTFPLFDESGTQVRVIRLASDISERVRLREEAARASHLAALGELAAGVAHEINNPTGLILLDLPIIRDAFADCLPILEAHFRHHGAFTLAGLDYSQLRDELPLMLAEVVDGAQRIKQIVEELKDFARPFDARQFVPLDLCEVTRKAVQLVGNQLKKATDHFALHCDESLPLCHGNPQRLEQVLINLILNACQALSGRDRGIVVTVRHQPEERRNLIEVRDEGVGIRTEHLGQVTDPFFTTRREVGGTGLGLSVSSRIIEEHGGTLHFDSLPERGTVVTVALPTLVMEKNHV